MSLVQPPVPERRPSMNMELGTNNPFRQRLSTPSSPGVTDPFSFGPSAGRPQSRNPFLDVFDDDNDLDPFPTDRPGAHKSNSFDATSTTRPQLSPQLLGAAAELFENLTITDHSQDPFQNMDQARNRMPPPRGHQSNGSRSRPPPPPPYEHHHSRSSDDNSQLISIDTFSSNSGQQRQQPRRPPPSGRPSNGDRLRESDRDRDVRRRPRRNSDSSVMDAHDAEKERERNERRRREQRLKAENGSGSGSRSKGKDEGVRRDRKKGSPLDVIDKLDVTGIYGSGLFHHDGPFDACNPHRNKKTHKLAPVHAFPADSANNALSGFGPVSLKADHSHLFGNRDPEAFHDFTSTGRRDSASGKLDVRPSGTRTASFDPKASETIHGDETVGLGTSTFLDGAPASKIAMERTMSETNDERPRSSNGGSGGGLQRKKSLAQKIRSISQNRTNMSDGPVSSGHRRPPPPGRSPTESKYSPTTPVSATAGKNDRNPFFTEYETAYDKKSEAIAESKGERAPNSPKKPARVGTGDKGSENGLLKRVRSLSKSKRRND